VHSRGQVIKPVEQAVLVNRKGQEIAIQDSAAPIRDRSGKVIGAVMVFHDVSKERRLQRALTYQATHDALTGLINRREFERRVQEALLQARSGSDVTHVMLYLDLDQFKVVTTPAVTRQRRPVAEADHGAAADRVRVTDTICQLGGDEFGILLLDCFDGLGSEARREPAAGHSRLPLRLAGRRAECRCERRHCRDQPRQREHCEHPERLRCGLLRSERLSRNRVHMYEHGAAPERHREMQWVSRLTRACEENRLELYYQPIVAIGRNPDKRATTSCCCGCG